MDFYERQELEKQTLESKTRANKVEEQDFFQERRDRGFRSGQKVDTDNKKGGSFISDSLNPKALFSAYKEIDFSQDWGYFTTIAFSIIADFFGLLPLVGGFFGFFFSIILLVIYFLGGQLKKRAFAKATIIFLTDFLESIGGFFLISFLPLFTLSALLIYWLELSSRSAHKMEIKQ